MSLHTMGCIKSTGRSSSPARGYGSDDDTGAQGASSSNRAGVVQNLTEARAFNTLLGRANRLVAQINGLHLQDPSRWGDIRTSALDFHSRLAARAESNSGDSVDTYKQEFEELKAQFQNT